MRQKIIFSLKVLIILSIFALTALVYYLVEDYRANGYTKKLIWLAPIFLVWVSLHIYFFIGLFSASLAVLEQLVLHFRMRDKKQFFPAIRDTKIILCK